MTRRRVSAAFGAIVLLAGMASGACGRGPGEQRPDAAGDPSRGEALVRDYGCGSCHTIPGVDGARGRVGPPLWAMGDRAYIGGVLPNTHPAMVRWIMNPREVTPRTSMPDLGVPEHDAADISAYLATLREEGRLITLVRGFLERARARRE